MIKWIHQNKRSVTVFLIAGCVVLSMSFFKVDLGDTKRKRFAIKVDDETVSFEKFQEEKHERQQALLDQYRKLFGNKMNAYVQQIYNMSNQQIIDAMISRMLLTKEAHRLNLYVGEDEFKDVIRKDMFGGNYDPIAYANFLTQKRKTSRGFEEDLKAELLTDNYKKLLTNVSLPSRRETEHFLVEQETTYDADFVEFDPSAYEKDVNVSDNAALEAYYNSRQTDFELPARVAYTYLVFDPAKNGNLVEISKDDIELYYADNESKYMKPESVKVKHIQITIPKDADDKKKEELKKKAEEAHAKATAGEPFEALVSQYSDDMASITNSGDLGWVNKGKMDKDFDSVVFKFKTPGIAPLITTDYGFHIAKIEEYKASEPKKLEEVKGEIESDIRKREAPAYTAAKAQETYDAWSKEDKPLSDIAQKFNLSVVSTQGSLEADKDPEASLKGLTKQVITMNDLKKQIIEIGDKSVLVQVDKYEESKIPTFSEAKEKVIATYKTENSKKLAKEAAQKILENIKAGTIPNLKTAADQAKLKIQEQKALSRKTPPTGVFADAEVKSRIFSTFLADGKPSDVYTVNGKNYLVSVTKINSPKPEDINSKIDTYREQALQKNAKILFDSNLARLKAAAEIDVDHSLMGDQPDI